jgi:hypothetical protein
VCKPLSIVGYTRIFACDHSLLAYSNPIFIILGALFFVLRFTDRSGGPSIDMPSVHVPVNDCVSSQLVSRKPKPFGHHSQGTFSVRRNPADLWRRSALLFPSTLFDPNSQSIPLTQDPNVELGSVVASQRRDQCFALLDGRLIAIILCSCHDVPHFVRG